MYCPVQPPSWWSPNKRLTCTPGEILQCDAVFPSSVALAAAASGTLTFDVSASNFQIFKPVGLLFRGVNLALTDNDHTRAFTATSIDYAGTNYLLSSGALNLAAYGVDSEQALSVFHVPELIPGGQDLTLSVTNNETTGTGLTLTLYAWLYGFAKR